MAKKGIREYRKALSFTKDKWNLKNNEPKESGTSVEDVIEYVQRKMYEKSIVVIDSDDNDNDNDEVVTASKLDKASIKNKNEGKDDGDDDNNDADGDDADGDDGDDDDGKKKDKENTKSNKEIVDDKDSNDDGVKDKEKDKKDKKISKKKEEKQQ